MKRTSAIRVEHCGQATSCTRLGDRLLMLTALIAPKCRKDTSGQWFLTLGQNPQHPAQGFRRTPQQLVTAGKC